MTWRALGRNWLRRGGNGTGALGTGFEGGQDERITKNVRVDLWVASDEQSRETAKMRSELPTSSCVGGEGRAGKSADR